MTGSIWDFIQVKGQERDPEKVKRYEDMLLDKMRKSQIHSSYLICLYYPQYKLEDVAGIRDDDRTNMLNVARAKEINNMSDEYAAICAALAGKPDKRKFLKTIKQELKRCQI